jgi:hypothetical protein
MAPAKSAKTRRPRATTEQCDGLIEVLSGYLTTPTRIPKYGPKLNKKALGLHIVLLLQTKKLQPNMAFAPLKMAKVLQAIATSNQKKWAFSNGDVQSFAKDVGPRVRMLCRHFMQNFIKTTKPKWFETIVKEGSKSIKDLKTYVECLAVKAALQQQKQIKNLKLKPNVCMLIWCTAITTNTQQHFIVLAAEPHWKRGNGL